MDGRFGGDRYLRDREGALGSRGLRGVGRGGGVVRGRRLC